MSGNDILHASSISPQVLVSQQLGTTDTALYTVATGQSVKIAHGVLCNVTGTMPAPAANGALSATAAGTLAATTYYVRSTWTTAGGETTAAAETSLAVAVNNVLNVAAPANPPAAATGWNAYVSTATGTETRQNGSTPVALGTAWVEPTSGLVSGAAVPATATTAAAVTVFLSVIKSGGTVGDNTHRVISSYSLAANDSLTLRDYLGGAMLGPGDMIAGYASAAGSVDAVVTGTVHA